MMIDYERLEVYQYALDFVRRTFALRGLASRGHGELVDQFRRASFSVVLNIAEGAVKVRIPDKQRYYGIARGSAMECAALMDLFLIMELVEQSQYESHKGLLRRIVSMLSALCLPKGHG